LFGQAEAFEPKFEEGPEFLVDSESMKVTIRQESFGIGWLGIYDSGDMICQMELVPPGKALQYLLLA